MDFVTYPRMIYSCHSFEPQWSAAYKRGQASPAGELAPEWAMCFRSRIGVKTHPEHHVRLQACISQRPVKLKHGESVHANCTLDPQSVLESASYVASGEFRLANRACTGPISQTHFMH